MTGILDTGDCGRGDNMDGTDSGQCVCKTFATGRRCDQCLSGYYNLTFSNTDGCQECMCDTMGTIGGSRSCDLETGQCVCKANVVGRDCSSCAENHYDLSNEEGCLPCHQECMECTAPLASDCLVSVYGCVEYTSVVCILLVVKFEAEECLSFG